MTRFGSSIIDPLFSSTAGFFFGVSLRLYLLEQLIRQHHLSFIYRTHLPELLVFGAIGALLFGLIGWRCKDRLLKNTLLWCNLFVLCLIIGPDYGLFLILLLLMVISALFIKKYGWAPDLIPWKSLSGYALLFALPSLVYYTLEWYYTGSTTAYKVISLVLGNGIFIIPLLFMSSAVVRKGYLVLVVLVHVLASFLYSMHVVIYGLPINMQALESILNTTYVEASEYVESFLTPTVALSFLVILALLGWRVHRSVNVYIARPFSIYMSVVLVLLFILHDNFQKNMLVRSYIDIESYQRQIDDYNALQFQRNSPDYPIISRTREPQLGVCIIGESLTRDHMSLYGYDRETTPRLSAMKDELMVFTHIRSADCYTQGSLKKMLTFANNEDMRPLYEQESIVDVYRRAGFETYWVSNQPFFGTWDNLVSHIASSCDHTYFLDNKGHQSLDGQLLPVYRKVLQDPHPKKMIFVHLIGSHMRYKTKYPPEYDYFTEFKAIDGLTDDQLDIINHYDNSVLYNDYVVSELFSELRRYDSISTFALYTSDHGENLYEQSPVVGHNCSEPTPNMFAVPFLLYANARLKNTSRIAFDSIHLNASYCTDDLIYSLIELSDLDFEKHKPERSIF